GCRSAGQRAVLPLVAQAATSSPHIAPLRAAPRTHTSGGFHEPRRGPVMSTPQMAPTAVQNGRRERGDRPLSGNVGRIESDIPLTTAAGDGIKTTESSKCVRALL